MRITNVCFFYGKGDDKMFRTMKYHYKCNDIEHRLLMFLFHISKHLYNSTLYTLRQDYFSNKKISSYFK